MIEADLPLLWSNIAAAVTFFDLSLDGLRDLM